MEVVLNESLQPVEYYYTPDGGFFTAALHAFRTHRTLKIDPDTVLTALLVQAGIIIEQSAEELRALLVSHRGKKTVTVVGENDMWRQLANRVEVVDSRLRRLYDVRFSTTTDHDCEIRRALLVASLKPYYSYCVTECGMKSVIVEGTEADWNLLADLLEGFEILKESSETASRAIPMWIDSCKRFAEKCALTTAGERDCSWWDSFVKEKRQSGGSVLNGHMAGLIVLTGKGNVRCIDSILRDVPTEILLVSIIFEERPDETRKYEVGNFMKVNGNICEAYSDIRIYL